MGAKRGTLEERFWRKVSPLSEAECWRWGGSFMRTGYGQINKGAAGLGMMTAHRASYEINKGKIPAGLCVMHSCDNKWCINPSHLSLGTYADNNLDRVLKGRNAPAHLTSHHGEKHGNAKLTAIRVSAIRNSPTPAKVIAAKYGITAGHVWRLRSGKNWITQQEINNVRC